MSSPPRYSSPLRASSPARSGSPYRNSSPLRASSPYRGSSPPRTPARNSSPLRSPSRSQAGFRSPATSKFSERRSSPTRTQLFPASSADISEVVSTFKQQIDLSRDLESAKISVSRQPDFTILDFFRLIDLTDKGYIISSDIQSLLDDLNVFYTADDVYLLVRHYSALQDSRIRFSDF